MISFLRLAALCTSICAFPALALTLSKDDEAARDAALQWLQSVDSGNYKDAALMMSERVRGAKDWLNYFITGRAPFGRVNKRHIVELKHASTVPGDYELRQHAIIRFNTSFEHKPAVIEEVVMAKMGCCWEVGGYSITAVASDK